MQFKNLTSNSCSSLKEKKILQAGPKAQPACKHPAACMHQSKTIASKPFYIQTSGCLHVSIQPVSLHADIQVLACKPDTQSFCMQTSRCSHEIQTSSQSASRHPDTCMKAKQNSCQSVSLHAVCCMQAIQSCLHADLQPLACIHLKQ